MVAGPGLLQVNRVPARMAVRRMALEATAITTWREGVKISPAHHTQQDSLNHHSSPPRVLCISVARGILEANVGPSS